VSGNRTEKMVYLPFMTVTSWVASTYKERPSKGKVIGLSSSVELVVELCWTRAKARQGQPKTSEGKVFATYSLDRGSGQPRHQFLDIPDTLSAPDWGPKPRTVPILQVIPKEERFDIPGEAAVEGGGDSRIIEPIPLLLREQGTKARVTKCDGLHPRGMASVEKPRLEETTHLKRTHVLHRVDIDEVELVTRDERIDPLQGGLEVSRPATSAVGVVDGVCARACLPTE